MIGQLGVKAAQESIVESDPRFRCGPHSVKALDYQRIWVIDPEGRNLGRSVESFNDGAASNFMKALVRRAIARQGGRGKLPQHRHRGGEK
ncbi:MAG: hypothetical protein H7836_08720 [Magnetococcus sp. YQC-3]